MSKFTSIVTGAAALTAIVAGALAVGAHVATEAPEAGQSTVTVEQVAKRKVVPAPTTVAGYRKMFAQVDTAEWGAADVSISQRLRDGRRVWLYGDTFSGNNGFVHSTAITQKGGTLHVSNGGAQLLPNDAPVNGRESIYWIEAVSLFPNGDLRIVAAPMSIGKASPWDFERRNEQSRVARATVDAAGDVEFAGWTGWTAATPSTDDFTVVGPNHFTYGGFTHTIRLANGEWLRTVNQNWDDDFANHFDNGVLRYSDYRPLFSSTSTAP